MGMGWWLVITPLSAVLTWKMRWSRPITFYETQTKQSDIFSIFFVICVRPFKLSINSTVTKTGWLCYQNVSKLSFASVRMCDCKRLSAHNFIFRRPQPPARCCDVDHRHDVRCPVSHARRYADEMSYSRRSPSLRWISVGDDHRCCRKPHGSLRSFSLTGTIF